MHIRWSPWRKLYVPKYSWFGSSYDSSSFSAGHNPLLRSSKPCHFFLGHSYGTNWVEYDTTGWLSYVRQNPASQNASLLLQGSQK